MKRFLAIFLSLAGMAGIARADGLFIDGDLAAAKAAAKADQKLVMIDFKAEWCGPCKMLDRTTWSDDEVIDSVKKKAVAVKIDVDQHGDLTLLHPARDEDAYECGSRRS